MIKDPWVHWSSAIRAAEANPETWSRAGGYNLQGSTVPVLNC